MFKKFYAGIGSRSVSFEVMHQITDLSSVLDDMGWTLRSGGANGCDRAFELGSKNKEIFLPWENFNNSSSKFTEPDDMAYVLAKKFHPKWNALNHRSKLLMARNTHQIFGYDFKQRSEFVVCWTPDGCEDGNRTTRETGGTGQALRIAAAYEIPIFNLKNSDAINRLNNFLKAK